MGSGSSVDTHSDKNSLWNDDQLNTVPESEDMEKPPQIKKKDFSERRTSGDHMHSNVFLEAVENEERYHAYRRNTDESDLGSSDGESEDDSKRPIPYGPFLKPPTHNQFGKAERRKSGHKWSDEEDEELMSEAAKLAKDLDEQLKHLKQPRHQLPRPSLADKTNVPFHESPKHTINCRNNSILEKDYSEVLNNVERRPEEWNIEVNNVDGFDMDKFRAANKPN